MKAYKTISRDEAEPLIRSKQLTLAALYEPDHAPKGTQFVYVQLTKDMVKLYRVRKGQGNAGLFKQG